jgi:HSP20 family protein
MTQLTHWNPFKSLAKASPQVDFDDFFRGFGMRPFLEQLQVPDIRLDVSETADAYAIKADIPGVKKEDIEVSVDGRQVTISATTAEKTDKRDKASLYAERCEGQAYRSFTLPTEVDSKGAKAHYENGVLELTLPKLPDGNGKRIRVS